jgi:hypothetical protein
MLRGFSSNGLAEMQTICRLCEKPDELCRSHVLPEFLYRPLYDEKHRFLILRAEAVGERYSQRGLTERLLCRACEQEIGRHEKYAAEAMSGRLGHHYRQYDDKLLIDGLDYARFKLFQISIIWRASVSTLEFFKLVSLGARAERVRHMLLEGDPGEPEEFGCVVIFAHDRGCDMSDTMFNPEPMRWAGRQMYKFFFAGAAWLYHCDQRPAASHLKKFFLQRDGTLLGLYGDLDYAKTFGPTARRFAKRRGWT